MWCQKKGESWLSMKNCDWIRKKGCTANNERTFTGLVRARHVNPTPADLGGLTSFLYELEQRYKHSSLSVPNLNFCMPNLYFCVPN